MLGGMLFHQHCSHLLVEIKTVEILQILFNLAIVLARILDQNGQYLIDETRHERTSKK